ncbi:MAG: hypothetical protein HYX76_02760 [Acidobacteria bacterium]|nr:hypothetical protein [Acidobacteriota bacterium]
MKVQDTERQPLLEDGWIACDRAARRQRVVNRHLCAACRVRRALFRFGGVVRADRFHTLCFQCYRALRDRLRSSSALIVREVGDPGKYAELDGHRRRAQIAARHAVEDVAVAEKVVIERPSAVGDLPKAWLPFVKG